MNKLERKKDVNIKKTKAFCTDVRTVLMKTSKFS